MKKALVPVLALLAVCVLAAPGSARTLDAIKKSGTLVVGVKSQAPPFGFLDKDKNPVGLDIDIARAVAQRIGVKPKFVAVTAADRIKLLADDKVDLVAATFTITPTRAAVVDFSRPYFKVTQTVLAKKGAVKAVGDLNGKKVAVIRGSTTELLVREGAPQAVLVPVPDALPLGKAVFVGDADVAAGDDAFFKALLKVDFMADYEIAPVEFSAEEYGLAVRKGNKGLLDAVNATIETLAKDGSKEKLFAKYVEPLKAEARPAGVPAFGMVVRTSTPNRYVAAITSGEFAPGAEVTVYDDRSRAVTKGKVYSIYTDSIYFDIPDGTPPLKTGWVVAANVKPETAAAYANRNRDMLGAATADVKKQEETMQKEIAAEAKHQQRMLEEMHMYNVQSSTYDSYWNTVVVR